MTPIEVAQLPKAHQMFEPSAALDGDVGEGEALISIAISMKRMADLMEGNPSKMGLVDYLGHVLEMFAMRMGR